MIFGEIIHDEHYCKVFPELLQLVESAFENVESGVQGDAYIWISEKSERIALDTFTSMRFQIKSEKIGGTLIEQVISLLEKKYKLYLYSKPEAEGHEDFS